MKHHILLSMLCCWLAAQAGIPAVFAQQADMKKPETKKESALLVRKIIPGDRLRISVAEQADLSRVYPVAGDGTIDFGFIGRINIAEKTVNEAAAEIKRLLEETFFKEASITVEVAEFVEGAILIIGAVQKTGALSFSGGDILPVMEAISTQGGLTREAAGNQVKILSTIRHRSSAG